MVVNLRTIIMLGLIVAKLEAYVTLMGASAVLVALWLAFTVLRQRRLERAAVILALICAVASVCLYLALWGLTV